MLSEREIIRINGSAMDTVSEELDRTSKSTITYIQSQVLWANWTSLKKTVEGSEYLLEPIVKLILGEWCKSYTVGL